MNIKLLKKTALLLCIILITELLFSSFCNTEYGNEDDFFSSSLLGYGISHIKYESSNKNLAGILPLFSSFLLSNAINLFSATALAMEAGEQKTVNSSPDPFVSPQINKKSKANEAYHKGNPTVVIYHTHTTECFLADPESTVYRSDDISTNMAYYGDIVSGVLYFEYGIETIHINEIFDQPYDTAYDKSADMLYTISKEYPSIIYAIDIHRDGVAKEEDNFSIYQTNISDNAVAKFMIVLGTNTPLYEANRAFSENIQNESELHYPTLMRKILEKPYIFNQNILPKSTLIELGSNLTTPEEAKITAVYLGRILGEVIKKEQGL